MQFPLHWKESKIDSGILYLIDQYLEGVSPKIAIKNLKSFDPSQNEE
jgi:hypothetical protein